VRRIAAWSRKKNQGDFSSGGGCPNLFNTNQREKSEGKGRGKKSKNVLRKNF